MPDTPEYHIEKLNETHRAALSRFDCGRVDVDEFAHDDIFEYQKQDIGVSYVLLNKNGKLLSFITLLMGAIRVPSHLGFKIQEINELPNQLPALKIGRLGTRKDEQKKGYAKMLIEYTIYLAVELRKTIGCYYITLDAYPENIGMYERCGFVPFFAELDGRDTMPMFMEVKSGRITNKQALGEES